VLQALKLMNPTTKTFPKQFAALFLVKVLIKQSDTLPYDVNSDR